nr:uncharacterized mitochondrial protein AtMg00810-like [Tanacetum cinerariifolium]
MLGLLDVHWSLKFARLIHGFLLIIKSRCVALKLFTVMQYWDKCIINFKEINDAILKTTFRGLQISQSPRGIFINQSKYALESLKKYGFESCDPVDILMVEKSKLDEDGEEKAVDPSHYRGMIGTLLYLTASRPDLQFA